MRFIFTSTRPFNIYQLPPSKIYHLRLKYQLLLFWANSDSAVASTPDLVWSVLMHEAKPRQQSRSTTIEVPTIISVPGLLGSSTLGVTVMVMALQMPNETFEEEQNNKNKNKARLPFWIGGPITTQGDFTLFSFQIVTAKPQKGCCQPLLYSRWIISTLEFNSQPPHIPTLKLNSS